MGRTARYDNDMVMDAALAVLQREGMRALSASRVCQELGAPSGSLYHRFASRDALLAELWLRCAERFQAGYFAALATPGDPRAAAHAAVRWFIERARAEPAETRVLMSYRREDLSDGDWPSTVQVRARALAVSHKQARNAFAARLRWPEGQVDVPRLEYALLGLPYAAVHAETRAGAKVQKAAVDWACVALDALLVDCFV
jgi:AcrR family transcriptional regulator